MKRARQHAAKLVCLLLLSAAFSHSVAALGQTQVQRREVAAEVFVVPDLPLSVQQASLVKTDKGYLFRCQLSNSSDSEMIGLRYALVIDELDEAPPFVLTRSEGFKLKPFATRRITFQTPLRINLKQGQRVVLMLDQAVSTHSIWEVVKAKDALNAYLSGDYSVLPSVIRVANQIDAPLLPRVIYRD